ncbi:AAA family ATPase [Wenzhouxiangella limi]|uniref:AAA family ATPase n=1 Tax=Wenzhouxiangella limi TaxID=2707351 RepID=A0A845UTD3_9GAMM|nr:AAA family ATPase [Wenzhouxiangella limi]NDY94797.1 AAA family ATPase [Wenzhouxiangella limi]
MYEHFYGLSERPFAITPNPRFVFLSRRHQDALAHLLYGVGTGGSGGFVQLTGEVGTGKTTLCRLVLEKVPENTRVALILNPMLSPPELLRAICSELGIEVADAGQSMQQLLDKLYRYLLERHAAGERVVLIVDEAQNMSREGLEQIRLLTNLETATDKLLQILLLGQPELRELLAKPELRQLAQRITARYHLDPLNRDETAAYVLHRLNVAGASRCPFSDKALRTLYEVSGGVPRLINIIADRTLLAGFARESERIDPGLVRSAAREVSGDDDPETGGGGWLRGVVASAVVVAVLAGGAWLAWTLTETPPSESAAVPQPAWQAVLADSSPESAAVEAAAAWPGLNRRGVAEACASSEPVIDGVGCVSLRGNWAYIRQIGLPAILRLPDGSGGLERQVLLVGMLGEQLLLRYQGQELRVPAGQLDRWWLGDFYVVWPDTGALLRPGQSGSAVAQMKDLAARLETGRWTGGVDESYDEAFTRWVQTFQRRNGLRDDGMIGPVTRLFLKAPHLDGPSLMLDLNGAG